MQLKVLHSIQSLNATDGGPARSVPALAAAESVNGADVVVWSQQQPTIDLSAYGNMRFVSGDIGRAIDRKWTPDIIHDHGLWLPSNHASARLGRHNRVPRVVSPRGMLEPWCLQHRRFRKLAAWRLYQHRDLLSSVCLHATSESEAEQFRHLGFEQPVALLPNGVTLPNIPQSGDVKHDAEQSAKREVLYLSRIHPVKGLPHLIEAWQQVARPGWQLRIVGPDEGGHQAKIRNLVNQNQLQNSVAICDAVHSEEKWTLLRNADLMVLPSFSENFGIVVAEALAVGTPVITTTGTPWSQVRERRCGWYVEPTVAGLSQALSDAMQARRTELDDMGQRGQQWVRQEFAWTDIGRKMLVAYDWLLGRGEIREWISDDTETRRQAA